MNTMDAEHVIRMTLIKIFRLAILTERGLALRE